MSAALIAPIRVEGDIADDTPARFIPAFRAAKAREVHVHVNSPGGSMIAAIAMFNAISGDARPAHATVTGLAGSAASYLLTAFDSVTMPLDGLLYVHRPAAGVQGREQDFRTMAEVLDKLEGTLIAGYVARTGQPEAVVSKWLDGDGTWFTADDALAVGLCDRVVGPMGIDASAAPANVRAATRARSGIEMVAACAWAARRRCKSSG